jgi:hypothetical protein
MALKQRHEVKRRFKRENKERDAKDRADRAILGKTPRHIMIDKLTDDFKCACVPDSMRIGVFCRACMILIEVDDFLMHRMRVVAGSS